MAYLLITAAMLKNKKLGVKKYNLWSMLFNSKIRANLTDFWIATVSSFYLKFTLTTNVAWLSPVLTLQYLINFKKGHNIVVLL